VSGNTLQARATDGTPLSGTLQGDQVTGTLGGGSWIGYVTRSGLAGLYRAHVGDETHLVVVAPDGSWVGGAFSPSGQLLRTWNSGTGTIRQVADVVLARPDATSSAIELTPVQDLFTDSGPWENTPWAEGGE
jgi:hypothetical protein